MITNRLGLAAAGALTASALMTLSPVALSGQSAVKKTPWGTADLQGTWSNTAVVPFARAKEYGDRQFLTDEEYKKAVADLLARNARPGRDSRESQCQDIRGTEKDVARAYN